MRKHVGMAVGTILSEYLSHCTSARGVERRRPHRIGFATLLIETHLFELLLNFSVNLIFSSIVGMRLVFSSQILGPFVIESALAHQDHGE
jgi:hypothetical protein